MAALAVVPQRLLAQERILEFESEITIEFNSLMTVVETLRVQAEHQRIRRGIYRDFPTEYRDRLGHQYQVGFEVESVLRDREPETYRLEPLANGIRVRIGQTDQLLSTGEHRYVLSYRTDRPLGYYGEHDELYWNVTGNVWEFEIGRASATVRRSWPLATNDVRVQGYAGRQGGTSADFHARFTPSEALPFFETTRPLSPGGERGSLADAVQSRDAAERPWRSGSCSRKSESRATALAIGSDLSPVSLVGC